MRRAWRALAAAAALALPACAQAKSFECLIQPSEVVEVRSPTTGVISKIRVQRGDRVKAGEVLVELDSSVERSAAAVADYRAKMEGRIKAANERLQYATKKLERAAELQKQHFVAAQAHDDALSEKRVAAADLEDALENRQLAKLDYRHAVDLLDQRTLRSPFDGLVIDRMLNPGDLTEYGTDSKAILKLAKIDPLRVEVVLPADYYGRLHLGMMGEVSPEGGLGGRYRAKITVIDRVFDAASGTFGVRLELPNPHGNVPGGIRCQVDFPNLEAAEAKPSASR
ncbi:MAG TPA: efflux RND transporter periplasmic adaptor subunit [Burkholderiales bacterium]|nr:efflux RND transporter periplasmic adaptor subunit [Burkholderiales bacterium]